MNLGIPVLKMIQILEAVKRKAKALLTMREKNVSPRPLDFLVFGYIAYHDEQFCRHNGKKDCQPHNPTKLKFPRKESDPEIPAKHNSRNPERRSVMVSVIKTENMA
jgi:hypothetical protein